MLSLLLQGVEKEKEKRTRRRIKREKQTWPFVCISSFVRPIHWNIRFFSKKREKGYSKNRRNKEKD